jgi:hypothetical protein
MARSADLHRVLLHHLAERFDPSRQAEPIETGGNLFHGFAHRDGVAFLSLESAPRAYRLKASNAAPPFSTSVHRLREIPQVFQTTGGRIFAPVPFLLIFSSLLL